ncbi:hypothetical protein Tco_0053421 [Tanacetum coccineum]
MDEGTKNHSLDHKFAGTNPSVLVDKTKSARDGLKTAHTDLGTNEESGSDEILKTIKLEDLSNLMQDIRYAFFSPDSPQDEPIIVSDESEEEETERYEDTHATSHEKLEDTLISHPLSPKSVQLQELMAQNTYLATKEANLKNDLVDLMGIDVVEKYHKKKLLYDKYYDKMLKRKKSPNIINCDVLTKKGPITLKVYREDRTDEVILNFKVSDLHLAEWREVVQACPDRKEKGWKTIYGLIKTRMEYLNQTKKELNIDFNKPLKEQDPLNELNDLANKKRKRTDDLKDHSRSTKKHKSLVQHEEEAICIFEWGRSLGSVPRPFSLSVDLNIKFYQDHLHFSLRGGTETEDKTLARALVQLG